LENEGGYGDAGRLYLFVAELDHNFGVIVGVLLAILSLCRRGDGRRRASSGHSRQ
jgi:hypothetical protein